MLCSGVFAGLHDLDWALARTDQAGPTGAEARDAIGWAGPAPVGGRTVDSYFEIHIEQGPQLWEAGIPLGIVVAPYLARGLRIEVTGENAHSGPTPMARRKNALVGAAAVALTVDRVGHDYRSEEHTSELQSLMRIPYAVFCLKKKKQNTTQTKVQPNDRQTEEKDQIH